MICRESHARLLEADPAAIDAALSHFTDRANGAVQAPRSSALTNHLLACALCREAAERILGTVASLAADLESLGPALALEEAVPMSIRESNRRRSRSRRGAWAVAAAVLAGVLAVRALGLGGAGTGAIEMVASRAGSPVLPEVEALLDESVLVLETDNEDVVVFWFYQGRAE